MKHVVEYVGPPIPSPEIFLLCEDGSFPVFSRDGTLLMISVPKNHRLQVWRVSNEKDSPFTLSIDQYWDEALGYTFSPCDPRNALIAGNRELSLMTTSKDETLRLCRENRMAFSLPICSCGFFPDGTTLFASTDKAIFVFDQMMKRGVLGRYKMEEIVKVLLSPNGKFFIVLTENGSIYRLRRGFLGWWRKERLQEEMEGNPLSFSVPVIAISSDNQHIAYLQDRDIVCIMRLDTKEKRVMKLNIHRRYSIMDVAFSSCGQFLVVASEKMLRIFSTVTWEMIASVKQFSRIIRFACSPNGRFMVVEGSMRVKEDTCGLYVVDFGGLLLGTLPLDMAPFMV
jgi:WD40 repeat protein